MNKFIIASKVITVILMLVLPCMVSSAIVNTTPPPIVPPEDASVVATTVELEIVVTVIKNEKPEVSGNLLGDIAGVADPLSLTLLDSPAGNYGNLDITFFPGSGELPVFTYTIKNDLPQVQALGISDVAKEIFRYQFITTTGSFINAKLTIFILGNPSVSFDNVEIEFNDVSVQATPINAGNPLRVGQNMRGQLPTANDKDWYVFNSLGNEIISLELCPEGSQCVDEGSWVLYVFDADLLAQQAAEFKTLPLVRFVDQTGEILSTSQSDHMYLLLNSGVFDDSLIGLIDPCFGDRRTLDIGVGPTTLPKNYLVAISSPLLRSDGPDSLGEGCGSGSVVLEREVVTLPDGSKIIEQFISAFPFSDDQYTLKVTRTGANPFAVVPPDFPVFDAIGGKVVIPKIRVNDTLFTLELEQLNTAGRTDTPTTFGILSIEALNEPLTADPYTPTFNPASLVVKLPQVMDSASGTVYSVEMLYQPQSDTLNLLKAEPVN